MKASRTAECNCHVTRLRQHELGRFAKVLPLSLSATTWCSITIFALAFIGLVLCCLMLSLTHLRSCLTQVVHHAWVKVQMGWRRLQ